MLTNKVNREFRGAGEEFAARGTLLGLAGHYAQAFCDVVGASPANEMVLAGFGKALGVVRILNNVTNNVVDAVCPSFEMFPAQPVPVRVPVVK